MAQYLDQGHKELQRLHMSLSIDSESGENFSLISPRYQSNEMTEKSALEFFDRMNEEWKEKIKQYFQHAEARRSKLPAQTVL